MSTEADVLCELVTAACELTVRYGRLDAADDRAVAEVALVRAELCALAATQPAGTAADDVDGAVGELDALLARLERLPQRVAALTG